MSKQSLEALFESRPRIKILKFLFRNNPKTYALKEIVNHTQENSPAITKELNRLVQIDLVRSETIKSKKIFSLNPAFEYYSELRDLILKSSPSDKRDLVQRINKLGKIKLAVISGVFLDKDISDPLAVDLFLVHDYVDRRKLTQFLKRLESEIGTEVRFATMDKEEFKYRFSMFDRFVRVLLEGPHENLIDKLGVEGV